MEILKKNWRSALFSFFRRTGILEIPQKPPRVKIIEERKKELAENIKKTLEKKSLQEKNISRVHFKERSALLAEREYSVKEKEAKETSVRRGFEKKRWLENQKLHFCRTEKEKLFEELYEINDLLLADESEMLSLLSEEAVTEHHIEKTAIEEFHAKQEKTNEKVGSLSSSFASPLPLDGRLKFIKPLDLFSLAVRTFRVKLGMTMLTILGIGVSFATIFFLVSFGYGIEKVLLDQFASGVLLRTVDVVSPNTEIIPLDDEIKNKIADLPGIEYIEPIFGLDGQIESGARAAEVEIRGAGQKYFELFGSNLKEGRPFKEGEKAVVISGSFLQTMDKKTLADFSEPFKIIAYKETTIDDVVKKETKDLGSFKVVGIDNDESNTNIYLSPEVISGFVSQYSSLKILVKSEDDIPALRDSISGMGLVTSSITDTIDQATKVFAILEILLALFGTASLIVATIGMVNTLTVSLLERTQEIGVMKVLGVADMDVRKLFLLEAAIIGGLGGLSGILMGFVFSQVFNFGINFLARNLGGQAVSLFYYPVWFVTSVGFASFVIGIFTGIVPAQRAAKMDPINAVKYK